MISWKILMESQTQSETKDASRGRHDRLVRPLTVFFEIDFRNHGETRIQWWPGRHKARFKDGYFTRYWWLCFAISWVRMDLHDYNRHIESGATEWRGAGGKRLNR